jgi:6-phosphofructokinase 1
MEGKFGYMVSLRGNEITCVPLDEVIKANKAVDPRGELVMTAKSIDICFGDQMSI